MRFPSDKGRIFAVKHCAHFTLKVKVDCVIPVRSSQPMMMSSVLQVQVRVVCSCAKQQ